MKKAINLCECLERLKRLGYIDKYDIVRMLSDEKMDVEEGQLCLKSRFFNTSWHEYNDEYFPIDYCPVCGKEIEYKKVRSLTKKN